MQWLDIPVDRTIAMSLAAYTSTAINFSSLHLNPILFEVGPFALRWYSLAYIAGILLGWAYLARLAMMDGAPFSRQDLDSLISWITIGIVAGGRIGYALFYDPATYFHNPARFLRLWEGGMSFHGGAAGAAIAVVVYCRRHGLKWFGVLDYVVMCTPIGLMLGRIANFINGELWGRTTKLPWGVVFPGAGPYPRHPSQMYEAILEGPILFTILWLLFRFADARQRPGLLTGAFVLSYGIFRFMIEFVREPDQQLIAFAQESGLHMGQWLSLPMIAVGLALMIGSKNLVQRLKGLEKAPEPVG